MVRTQTLAPPVTTSAATDASTSATQRPQRIANSPAAPRGPRPTPSSLAALELRAPSSKEGAGRVARSGVSFAPGASGVQRTEHQRADTASGKKPLPTSPAAEENAAADGPKDPGFSLPVRPQRLGQPIYRDKPGFSLLETNKLRPEAQVATAIGISTHTTSGAATDAVVGGGFSIGHETAGALVNGHAFIAARERKQRYGEQLDTMLKDDLGKFKNNVDNGVPMRPETMIFKRKNGIRKAGDLFRQQPADPKGKAPGNAHTKSYPAADLEYDMDAVRKLAASDDPELTNEAAHAKNVLLTAFLKDDVAAKQGNRAAYEFIRNTVAIGAATATAIGTHGASVAIAGSHAASVAASERIAGAALAGANTLDVAKGMRGLKQRLRDGKSEVVNSYELQKRHAFAESVAGKGADPAVKQAFDGLGDARGKVIKDAHLAIREQARMQAGAERYRRFFPGTMIDDRKSTNAKKETRDLVGKHAFAFVEYQMGLSDPVKQPALAVQWNAIMQSGGTRKSRAKQFAAAIDADPGMKAAYLLLRDTGMSRSESVYTMQRMVEMSIESMMAKAPELAAFGASADFGKDDAAQKAATSRLTSAFARR